MTTFEKMKAQMQNIAGQAYPNLKKGWGWACTAAGKCAEWCKRAYQKAKPHVIVGAENIRHRFLGLQPRTRTIVAATTGVLVVGMLGLAIAGMSGSGGQSPNVPQVGATVVVADDTQTKPAGRENEGTVFLAQVAPTPQQVARNRAEVPNAVPPVIGLEGHTGSVRSVAFSPDGKKIVTGGGDRTPRIWDAETGKELRKLEGHTSMVLSVAFSPDGKKIVTGSSDRTARIWDAETGKELQKLEGHTESVSSVAFSPDGKRIVTASEGTRANTDSGPSPWSGSLARSISQVMKGRKLRIWDTDMGKELIQVSFGHHTGNVSASFSPDGMKIVTTGDGETVWIRNAETGKELRKLDGHTSSVDSAAFSPDGKKIVTVDRTSRIWDAETGKELQKLEGHTSGVDVATFSPDGKKIVTGSWDRTARIWDAETGKELQKLEGHTSRVDVATFSPDGKKIVTGSWDRTARIWDAETGKELQKLEGHTSSIRSVAFSPDGKRIVTSDGDITTLWDALHVAEQVAILLQQREKEGAERLAAEKRQEAERLAARMTALAGAINLNEELQKCGLTSLEDFVKFGTSLLKNYSQHADAFDRADATARVRSARTEISQKVFVNEYTFSTANVTVSGDRSNFVMIIPTRFFGSTPEEIIFPQSDVAGMLRYFPSQLFTVGTMVRRDQLVPIALLAQADLNMAIREGRLHARFEGSPSVTLSVSGSTNSARELVRNSDNYRARIWFTNLQERAREVKYRGEYESGTRTLRPVKTGGTLVTFEADAHISADILKIEIIKIR